jgi:tetratricopeptide (TPR) repeat protein
VSFCRLSSQNLTRSVEGGRGPPVWWSFSGIRSCSVDGVVGRIFISHTGKDRAWAEWARWHLETAGYATELDSVDWAPGTNVMEAMNTALRRENPLLVLLSSAYLDPERFTTDEWTTRLAQRRRDPNAKLIPLRVENVDLYDGLWAPIAVPDMFGLAPDQAATLLLDAVRQVVDPASVRNVSKGQPAYPGRAAVTASAEGPRPPGSLPAVWNLARRNLGFTGRDSMLNQLHDALQGGKRVAVQALAGLGGVGKTQLVLEYAHRFAGEYDVVWWIPSEQSELIGEHLAALAQSLRLVPMGAATPAAVGALQEHLRRTGQWLLIFDNAEDPDQLAPWLPDGPGDLLITSRNPNWAGVAQAMDVDVFTRAESIALLLAHLNYVNRADADRLAEMLDDLPLAVGQAMNLLAETRMPIKDYLGNLATHTAEVMNEGRSPGGYPVSLAATVTLTAGRLENADAAAGHLLYLFALLGPEPIPHDLFTAQPDLLPDHLRALARRPVAFARTVAQLGRYGLARLTDNGPILHRLVQAVLRDSDPGTEGHRDTVERLLAAAGPDDGSDPQWWPRWSVLLPHIIATNPADTSNPDLRTTTSRAVWHLNARGDARTALPLAEHLYRAWAEQHGPNNSSTLDMARTLGVIHRELGDYQRAHDLDQDRLIREQSLHGPEHLRTLDAATGLALSLHRLGEYERARELDEVNFAIGRRVLGDDHPDTLTLANNLACDLFQLGGYEQARTLHEETLARRRRLLGEDHPQTLGSASNLAQSLRFLGESERALDLDEETLARRRRVLGDQHPDILKSANNLAADLDALGRHSEADELRRRFPPRS